jgi:prephenate dehydrogenase
MIQSAAVELGLIGFGRFGQFAAKHLRQRMDLTVWDPRDLRKKAAALGVRWGAMPDAASKGFVLLAVPISELPGCLTSISMHLEPGALLMDCCSVKVRPIRWMLEAAPAEVEVIGTHPLFGPQSGRGGVQGMQVVLCPARTRRAEMLKVFLQEMGLTVHVVTPEEHDRAMAATQALPHFLTRALIDAGLQDQPLKTPAFDRLMRMAEMLRHDSQELFHDMHRLNPYAALERRRLLEALLRINNDLEALPSND